MPKIKFHGEALFDVIGLHAAMFVSKSASHENQWVLGVPFAFAYSSELGGHEAHKLCSYWCGLAITTSYLACQIATSAMPPSFRWMVLPYTSRSLQLVSVLSPWTEAARAGVVGVALVLGSECELPPHGQWHMVVHHWLLLACHVEFQSPCHRQPLQRIQMGQKMHWNHLSCLLD